MKEVSYFEFYCVELDSIHRVIVYLEGCATLVVVDGFRCFWRGHPPLVNVAEGWKIHPIG